MQNLLTVDQVADRLRCHRETVLRHVRTGQLRAARIGKGYVVTESALAAFVEARAGDGPDNTNNRSKHPCS